MTGDIILYKKDIKAIKPDLEAIKMLSRNLATTTQTVVMNKKWKTLDIVTTNNNPNLYHQIIDKFIAQGYEIQEHFTDDEWILIAFWWYEALEAKERWEQETFEKRHSATWKEAFILLKETYADIDSYEEWQFIDEVLRLAFQAWASDVHFQSEEVWVVMRIRIDGMLQTALVFSQKEFQKYLLKIKYRSWVKMNLGKISQDGRFDFPVYHKGVELKIDVRVSILPGLRGESLVLRFLDSSQWVLDFKTLGCEPFHIDLLEHELQKNFWLILVTWPTGSWKTTTVYSLLNELNTPEKKIITLEDPVEYELPWVEQSQINEKEKFTFEAWLKWVLRHDPDIIMVWEIRTLASAEMAVNAALTWHLVISTLHTNSATESITRLLNMGVKPFMLASALNLIIWQRLMRKIDNPKKVEAEDHVSFAINKAISRIKKYQKWLTVSYDWFIHEPQNKDNAFNSGYKWRTWIFEMFKINEVIKQAIIDEKTVQELHDLAVKQWFMPLNDAAYLKLLKGETSYDELLRTSWTL